MNEPIAGLDQDSFSKTADFGSGKKKNKSRPTTQSWAPTSERMESRKKKGKGKGKSKKKKGKGKKKKARRDRIGRELDISMRLSDSINDSTAFDGNMGFGDLEGLLDETPREERMKRQLAGMNDEPDEDPIVIKDVNNVSGKSSVNSSISIHSESFFERQLDEEMKRETRDFTKIPVTGSSDDLGGAIEISNTLNTVSAEPEVGESGNSDGIPIVGEGLGDDLFSEAVNSPPVKKRDPVKKRVQELDYSQVLETPKSRRIKDLGNENVQLKESIQYLQETETNLQNDLQELREKLKEADVEKARVVNEMEEYKRGEGSGVEDMGMGLKDREEIVAEKRRLLEREDELRKREDGLMEHEKEIARQEEAVKTRERTVAEKEREIESTKLRNEVEVESENVARILAETRKTIELKDAEIRDLVERNRALVDENKNQRGEVLQVVESGRANGLKLTQLARENTEMNRQINTLENENKIMQRKLVEAAESQKQRGELDRAHLEKLLDATQEDNKRLVTQMKDFQEKLKEKDNVLGEMGQKHRQVVNELQEKLNNLGTPAEDKQMKLELEKQVYNLNLEKVEVEKLRSEERKKTRDEEKRLLGKIRHLEDELSEWKQKHGAISEKLEWYLENQDLIRKQEETVKEQAVIIAKLEADLENAMKRDDEKMRKDRYVARIMKENEEMKARLQNPTRLSVVMRNATRMSLDDVSKGELASEIDRVREDSNKRLRMLKQDFDEMKVVYEKKIILLKQEQRENARRDPAGNSQVGRKKKDGGGNEKKYEERARQLQHHLERANKELFLKNKELQNYGFRLKNLDETMRMLHEKNTALQRQAVDAKRAAENELSLANRSQQQKILEIERSHMNEMSNLKKEFDAELEKTRNDLNLMPASERERRLLRNISEIQNEIENIRSKNRIREMELIRSMNEQQHKFKMEREKDRSGYELKLQQKVKQVRKFKLALETLMSDIQRFKKLKAS